MWKYEILATVSYEHHTYWYMSACNVVEVQQRRESRYCIFMVEE